MEYNTGAMRSPFSPRVRQSLSGRRQIGIGSAKNNPSKYNQPVEDVGGDVIYKTPLITLETYGPPLPVMVTEALTFANGEVSVRLSGCGWCWVVAGRRVLAWPVDGPACPGPAAARELTLPQTDLAHKADLVMLFYEDGAQMPSCIGVSPEGVVRYWASVGQEGAYVDVSCELAGQECDRLACSRSKAPLVLATTTCTLVLLTPSTVDGRATVSCRTLRPPSGWLGGIGRRVSLMFFGSMPAHVDTKLVGVAVVGDIGGGGGGEESGAGGAEGCIALVAGGGGGAGPVLQVWRGGELHEHELRRALLPDAPAPAAPAALQLRAAFAPDLLLLFAHPDRTPNDARYYIAQISLADVAAPRVTRLVALRGGGAPEEPPAFLPLPAHVLLYTRTAVALHPAGGGDKPECLELGAEGDRVLGGELGAAGALLFSLRHGLLRLKPHAHHHRPACGGGAGGASAPVAFDVYEGSLSLYEIDPLEINQQSLDLCGQLKTAFLFHVRRDAARCRTLLGALAGGGGGGAPDSALDRTVVLVARDMLDDAPQGDPRWPATAAALALGRSPALQLAQQLADKRRAFALFLEFLQNTHLLPRLQTVTYGGGVVPCVSVLCWLGGMLGVGALLRERQTAGGAAGALVGGAVVAATARALDAEEPEVAAALQSGALSADDVCYRRVSGLHGVLAALAEATPRACGERARLLELLAAALEELARTRLAWAQSEAPPPEPARALLPPLRDLVAASVRSCGGAAARSTGGADGACAEVLERAGALADALLALAAPLPAAQHDALRDDLIRPFVEAGELERAGALAERHGALRLLVEMCVRAGDAPRLLRYARAHAPRGLVELACARLAAERRVRLLLAELGAAHPDRLRAWLARGGEREGGALAALHALHEGAPGAAAVALARLADAERGSVRRARTAASLGKLCLAAAGGSCGEQVGARLERRLTLCAAQERLPRALRVGHALDGADAEPLEPEELVQVYVSAHGGAPLSEYEYKVALELVELVEEAERRAALRRDVWCAAVLRDTWDTQHADPQDELQNRCIFRLMDLLHVSGASLELVLPPLTELLAAPALAELVARPAVHHLLKYGYECLAPPPRAASA